MVMVVLLSCDSGEVTRFQVMKDIGPHYNAMGHAINDKDLIAARGAHEKLHEYLNSKHYLNYREQLEKEVQIRYQIMEKRIFDIGPALDGSFEEMRKAYTFSRVSCMDCHLTMRRDSRDHMEKEIVQIVRR